MAGRGYVKVDLAFVGHDQISATIKKTQDNLAKTGTAAEKVGKKSKDAFEKMKKGTESLSSKLTGAAAAVYLVQKAMSVAQEAFDFVKQGEQIKNLGLMFSKVVDETGMALELFQQKTGGIVDADTLQKTGIEFANLGFSIRESAAVMEVATVKSMAEMKDFSSVAQDLGKTIVSGRKESLEALGITIDFRKEYEKYARTIGTNVKNLTKTDELHVRMHTTLKAITEDTALAGINIEDFYTLGQRLGVGAQDMLGDIQADTSTFVENMFKGTANAEVQAQLMENAINNITSGTGDLKAAGHHLDKTLGLTGEFEDRLKTLGQTRKDQESDLDFGDTLYEWTVGLVTTTDVEQAALEATGAAHIELMDIIVDAKEAKKKAYREEILAAQEHQKDISNLVSRNRIFQYETVEELGKKTNEIREKNLIEAKAILYGFYSATGNLQLHNIEKRRDQLERGYEEEQTQAYRRTHNVLTLEKDKNGQLITLQHWYNDELEKMVTRGVWGTVEITEYGYKKIESLAENNYRILHGTYDKNSKEARQSVDEIQEALISQISSVTKYSDEWAKLGEILEKGGLRETTPQIEALEQQLLQTTVESKKEDLQATINKAKATLDYENLTLVALTSKIRKTDVENARNAALAEKNLAQVDALNKTLQQIETDISRYEAFDLQKMIATMVSGNKKRGSGRSWLNKQIEKSSDLLEKELALINLKKYATDANNEAEQKALVISESAAKQADLIRKKDLELGKKLRGKTEEDVTGSRLKKLIRINEQFDIDQQEISNATQTALTAISEKGLDRRRSHLQLDTEITLLNYEAQKQALIESIDAETSVRSLHDLKMFELKTNSAADIDRLEEQKLKKGADVAEIDKQIEIEKLNFKKEKAEEEKALIQDLADVRQSDIDSWSNAIDGAFSGLEEYGHGWATALAGVQDVTAAISDNIGDQKKQASGAIAASGQMFSSFSKDAQANAGIRAAFEFAAGWAAFPDPAGMASHFTAAALFGALAGKKPSGSKAKAKAGGAKLGTFGGKKTGAATGANVKSNITVNVSGFALGSSSQIGKAIGDSVGEFDGSHSGRV